MICANSPLAAAVRSLRKLSSVAARAAEAFRPQPDPDLLLVDNANRKAAVALAAAESSVRLGEAFK